MNIKNLSTDINNIMDTRVNTEILSLKKLIKQYINKLILFTLLVYLRIFEPFSNFLLSTIFTLYFIILPFPMKQLLPTFTFPSKIVP